MRIAVSRARFVAPLEAQRREVADQVVAGGGQQREQAGVGAAGVVTGSGGYWQVRPW